MVVPCKNCAKRVIGCHINCEDYKAYVDNIKLINNRKQDWSNNKHIPLTLHKPKTYHKSAVSALHNKKRR